MFDQNLFDNVKIMNTQNVKPLRCEPQPAGNGKYPL